MSKKAKGGKNERKTMALLKKAGYECTKSGGSFGVWDVIGIGSTDFVVCQVKSNDWPGSAEMETLKNFRCPSNCKKLVHRWKDYARQPDVREL